MRNKVVNSLKLESISTKEEAGQLRLFLNEMKYKHLAVSLTSRCNANCSFCCNKELLKKPDDLDFEQICSLIRSSVNLGMNLGFTGGECILHPKWEAVLQYVKSQNVPFSLISNGAWAKDKEMTTKKIASFLSAGCTSLTVSTDYAHQEFIPLSNIINILNASHEHSLPLEIQTVIYRGDTYEWIPEILQSGTGSRIISFPGYPAGGAADYSPERIIRKKSCYNQFCGKSGTLFVDQRGHGYPCCSPLVETTAFDMGDVSMIGLKGVIENIKQNAILIVIRNFGFDPFLEFCDESGIDYPKKIVDSCELCSFLFNKDQYFKFIIFACNYIRENL